MRLPTGFEALEPFVKRWAIGGTAARDALRGSSSAQERQAFYAAAQPLLAAALDYLDARPIQQFDDKETRLMELMLSLAHIAIAVEIQQEDEPQHALARAHMRITRSPADEAAA
jgi:hypothetical protein